MATVQAPANFNVLDKDKNLNKDYRKLTKGLRILGGNRWASFFGASNYQKINRSYRSQFVQKRSDGKGGVILFDTRTQKPTNDELINKAIVTNVTGSANPTADLKYINARGRAEIQKNIGNLKDGVSLNDLFYHTRRLFSDPVYNDKGERIGKEIDLKRNIKADQLRIKAGEASLGTRYDEFLDPASPVYRGGGKEVGQVMGGGLPGEKNIPLGQGQGQGELVTNTPQPVPANQVVVSKNAQTEVTQEPGSGDGNKKPINTPTPVTGSLNTWSRGSGESLSAADGRTELWLQNKGVDTTQISKFDKREVYRNLRIGGPHIVNGMLQLNTGGRGANSRFSLKINQS